MSVWYKEEKEGEAGGGFIRCGEVEKWRMRYDPDRRVAPRLAVDTNLQSCFDCTVRFVYVVRTSTLHM